MTRLGGWGQPGTGTIDQSTETEITWGGDAGKGMVLSQSAIYDGAARDAGNTPTTVLRAGLLMGKLDTGDQLTEWDASQASSEDGSQNIWGVCPIELRMVDFDANNADRAAPVIVQAPLKAGQLLIQGTAFTSHADEFIARRHLHAMGCVLDDDPQGYKAGQGSRVAQVTGTTDTLTEAENGTTLFYDNAASVTVTLPTIHAGLEYTLIRNGDEEFVVTSGEGDNIIGINDLSVDSVTFTTATEHLGVAVKVRSLYMGTTLKWLVDLIYTAHDAGGTTPATYTVAT